MGLNGSSLGEVLYVRYVLFHLAMQWTVARAAVDWAERVCVIMTCLTNLDHDARFLGVALPKLLIVTKLYLADSDADHPCSERSGNS